MVEALWAETVKLRRSRVPWVTAPAFAFAVGVGGLFMFILQDPPRARSLGLLGTKAQLASGTADWPAYFDLLAQITAVGGFLIFALVVIWCFGREFSDHTVTDLLALPTPRTSIVAAKFAVTSAWCLWLAVLTYALGLVVGAALRLPGWSAAVAVDGLAHLLATAVMTVWLVFPFALAASIGRGYLTAVGMMFLAVVVAQVLAALGYGHHFPWSVPALYSGVAGPEQTPTGPLGYVLVLTVGFGGLTSTIAWWRSADQSR